VISPICSINRKVVHTMLMSIPC